MTKARQAKGKVLSVKAPVEISVDPRLIRRLTALDRSRLPILVARKYRLMAQDAFAFFRGSNHLFQADFPRGLKHYPKVWLNGDLHLENFGTYRGENRLTYFDIGDFDDGALGPASRDLLRFLTALHLALPVLGITRSKAKKLSATYLGAYRDALRSGKALWLERNRATGLIGELMHKLDKRLDAGPDGSSWLRSRITGEKAHARELAHGKKASRKRQEPDNRRLRLDTGKALPVSPENRAAITTALAKISRRQQASGHGDWQILDIAWRIAGLSTLGLPRFSILVQVTPHHAGETVLTTEGDLLLLDLKLQPGSVMAPHLKKQPRFASEAARVVAIEKRLQAMNPALLAPLRIAGKSYVLRELQPEADKLDLKQIHAEAGQLDMAELEQAIDRMGRLTAWAQLRSAGRQGSAIADELIDFGTEDSWVADLLSAAAEVADQQTALWQATRGWLAAEAARLAPAGGPSEPH